MVFFSIPLLISESKFTKKNHSLSAHLYIHLVNKTVGWVRLGSMLSNIYEKWKKKEMIRNIPHNPLKSLRPSSIKEKELKYNCKVGIIYCNCVYYNQIKYNSIDFLCNFSITCLMFIVVFEFIWRFCAFYFCLFFYGSWLCGAQFLIK